MAIPIPLLSKDFGIFIPKVNKSSPIEFGDLKISIENKGRLKVKLGKKVTTVKVAIENPVFSVIKGDKFARVLPKTKPKVYFQQSYIIENALWELGFCNQSEYPYGMRVSKGNIYTAIRELENQYPSILTNYRDTYNKYYVIEGDGYKVFLYHHKDVDKPMPLVFQVDRTPEVYNSIDIEKLVEELILEMSKTF